MEDLRSSPLPARRTLLWAVLAVAMVLSPLLVGPAPWLKTFPQDLVLPVTPLLNQFMAWFVAGTQPLFRALAWLLGNPITGMRVLLQSLPWPLTVALVAVAAHAVSGPRLAVFAALGMLYMAVIGYWPQTMNTLALVAISVPLSVAIGFLVGAAAFRWPRTECFIMPALDFLQTVPTFAYLIPILLLFGFGPVTGLVASLLYAFPAMVRNTLLGLRRVPLEVVESGLMSGAVPWQLFWQVRVPTALRQVLLGVNQTTMAALSMVIVASIIGGTQDIGWEVLSTLRKAAFGESLLAGLVIALLAMVMDRVTSGMAESRVWPVATQPFLMRHRHLALAAALVPAIILLANWVPFLDSYPKAWTVFPAQPINRVIDFIVVDFKAWIDLIKRFAFYFVMLPLRIGLENAVKPMTWGFEWSLWHSAGYAVLTAAAAAYAARRLSLTAGPAIVMLAAIFFFGITNIPWPVLIALVTALAWAAGGPRLAIGTLIGLLFLLLSGIWVYAVLSVYLCGIAVLLSFSIGSVIGILAAGNDTFSRIIRPINDTLQTMPLFVLLIPIIMIFQLGDFTALIAICLYAMVPSIRYAEHALRHLPADVIEAATAMGSTPRQLLWQVKMPMALPELMLGLNQTILYGIAMLVITALVGTKELGQQVYVGLSNGDFGVGFVAGLGMAVIAMIADRMTQAWSRRKRTELGLA
ncbi:MAG: ABC transporter permease [Pseudomonadota bacterium]